MRPALLLVMLALVGLGAPSLAAAQEPKADELVARAVEYVTDFVNRFSGVVAEEHYVQNARSIGRPGGKGNAKQTVLQGATTYRELISDFLLVQLPGLSDWRTFRDVREVDGRPVGDRQQRLSMLFLEPSGTAVERATQIDRDGTRYNLGDETRTINNPLLALGFLQPAYQRRFRFSLRGVDKEVGPDVWILEYREQARPTLLRSVPDADLVAVGRLWVERLTGRVVKTELAVSDSDSIVTSFKSDSRLQIDVPAEMQESYWSGGQYVTGTATYRDFRRFEVRTEEKLK